MFSPALKSALKRPGDLPRSNSFDSAYSEPELLFDMELESDADKPMAKPKSLLARGLHALRIQIPQKSSWRRHLEPLARELDEVSLYSDSAGARASNAPRRVRFLVPSTDHSGAWPYPPRADDEEPTWMDF
ncbi:hypothetical protein MKEN_01324500 [Mycena kentingensis (nom. inval.)]|nr:hypothetical protein MKEN_01324500 [Mycena kentingensis (nom. inval.)]